MKFYKYTSLTNAINIIKSGSVILNNPKNFNDPFDADIIIDENDKRKAFDLMYNYSLFKMFKEISNRDDIKLPKKQKCLIEFLRKECLAYESLSNKFNEYQKIPLLNKCLDIIEKYKPGFKKLTISAEKEFENKINSALVTAKDEIFITCFSKRNDSILMWSHYGDSHKGICFEFNEDRDIFKDVTYSNSRPFLNLEKFVSRFLMYDQKGKIDNFVKIKYIESIFDLYFVKQLDWSYEQEVRCVLSKDENKIEGFYSKDGQYLLKMNISKLYIGINARKCGEFLDLIQVAREKNIPIIFMKEDAKCFRIIPDFEKIEI